MSCKVSSLNGGFAEQVEELMNKVNEGYTNYSVKIGTEIKVMIIKVVILKIFESPRPQVLGPGDPPGFTISSS
jgi:hypothetical protein